MKKIKVVVVFGTRPEAIKMAPVIKELDSRNKFKVFTISSSQHKEMLDQVIKTFKIKVDYDLKVMKKNQTLIDINNKVLKKTNEILEKIKPDIVLVHGDTSTTLSAGLAAFYNQIPVGHIEAGLRTNDIYSPFPEEYNRKATAIIAKYHFAPTKDAKNNLIKENIKNNILVTGNTSIDAIKITTGDDFLDDNIKWAKSNDSKFLLLTTHRRENLGQNMKNIFKAINNITKNSNTKVIFPVHKNPKIVELANNKFKNNKNVRIIDPLDVHKFHNYIKYSDIILTDSGGIQEEAPFFKKPVLVLRNKTERLEGIKAKTLKLIGIKEENITKQTLKILNSKRLLKQFEKAKNPYGDGFASMRIADFLIKEFLNK